MTFKPNYIKLLENGKLSKKAKEIQKHLINCKLCPHECGVNRKEEVGVCQAGHRAIVSGYGPHFEEEKVLVGEKGSGTIFLDTVV